MAVQCIECVHLSGRDTPAEFRRLQFLRCRKAPSHEFFSPTYPRECAQFAPAGEADVKARQQWLNRGRSDAQSAGSTATP